MKNFCFCLVLTFSAGAAISAPRPEPKTITASNATEVQPQQNLPGDVWEMAWGPKSGELSFLAWEKPIEVLDASTYKPLRQIASGKRVIHFAIRPDVLAWCENNTSVVIHDLKSDKTVTIDTNNSQPAMAFSPDGKLLATGGYGTQAKLWEVPSGKFVRALEAGGTGGLRVVFSPNGKRLAIGNRNDMTHLYEVETGRLLHTLSHKMTQELKFSPDGRTLAVAYVDGTVTLWDAQSGILLASAASGADEVYTLDWSLMGDLLVTAGRKGKITLWKPAGLKILKELDAPEWVISVRFSPDGIRLLTCGGGQSSPSDRKTTIWTVRGR